MGHQVPRFITNRMGFQLGMGFVLASVFMSMWDRRVNNYNNRVNDYYKQLYASHPELLHVSRNPTPPSKPIKHV